MAYIVPAGKYERVLNEASNRMVIDPDSFQYIDKTPVNLFNMFISLVEGLIEADGDVLLRGVSFKNNIRNNIDYYEVYVPVK